MASARLQNDDALQQEAINDTMNVLTSHVHCDRANVVEVIQEFWRKKLSLSGAETAGSGAFVTYESLVTPTSSHVCFVTLPGGSCFGSIKNCASKAGARRNAAKIALVNSLFNDHPSRLITEDYVNKVLEDTVHKNSIIRAEDIDDASTGIGAFKFILSSYVGHTMLELKELMTMFELLHWNGSLRAMRERNCSRQEIFAHYSQRILDDDIRSQMALDWISREQTTPGVIQRELDVAERDLECLRCAGQELRFPKEKRDILLLALSQISPIH